MKSLFLSFTIFSFVNAVQAATLASCDARGLRVQVDSGRTAREAIVTFNGTPVVASRRMSPGQVDYTTTDFRLSVIGSNREMGNPIGYITSRSGTKVVICRQGVDIEKIAADTEMY